MKISLHTFYYKQSALCESCRFPIKIGSRRVVLLVGRLYPNKWNYHPDCLMKNIIDIIEKISIDSENEKQKQTMYENVQAFVNNKK